MNKNKLVNNQYRKQEFNKRRKFRGAESLCPSNGDCPIFQNCLLEIDQLTNNWNELEEWAKSEKERFREIAINQGLFIDKELSMRIDTRIKLIDSILDKMKEIKGGKDVSNNN